MNFETKTCNSCSEEFSIADNDLNFYKKIDVPTPEKCPRCRQRDRISFRNFKTLYKRKSDKSGESIISMYSDKVPFPVWSHDEWWADDWDARDYGRDFDFSRPFFEQFADLLQEVPRYAVMNSNSPGSDYSNISSNSKNCYLVFGSTDNENCAYGHIVWESKDCFDCLYIYKSELCYECVDVLGSYRVLYSEECEDCADSVGLYDCRGCTNCIGCVGLRQKNYCIFNEQKTKEEYEEFLKEHPLSDPDTIELILKEKERLRREMPQRDVFGTNMVNSSGNHLYNTKNAKHAFDVKRGEDIAYVYTVRNTKDSRDVSFSIDIELGYQIISNGMNNSIIGGNLVLSSSDIYYSESCFNVHHAFGATGCKGQEYIILNKQYDKASFEDMKNKLIEHMKKTGEWGKFFPVEMSPFAYNESIANEYMPLTKEEAMKQGFRWEDDIPRTSGQETKEHQDLPANPSEYSPDLAKEILKCDNCSNNYRLIPQEIGFYKQLGLPIPKECFNCRHERRMKARNSRELWPSKCTKCSKEIETSFDPKDQEQLNIYCKNCYQNEVM